ncbi:MAG TPA: PQQ-binding-like beta-propeller repeat protein [Lacipirellulaceae bacterium]|nr:PQQ-binding-like beta-propeller repeat protein [Lacipirellulaceae bacterium]
MGRFRIEVRTALAAAALLATAAPLHADWPQWRGPNRDDVSAETGLLKSWPEGGPKRLWMVENGGLGYAGPAIVGGRIFLLGTTDEGEVLTTLDADSGEQQWTAPVGELYENDWGNGPRSTPTVEGDFVYAMGAQGNLVCVRAGNGEVVWTKSMTALGGKVPQWGFAESPFIYKNTVLCTPGGEQGAIAALDKATGEVLWRTADVKTNAHYSSLVAMPHGGHDEVVQLLADQLLGLNPTDGKVLWSVPWPKPVATIPTPLVHGNSAYATSAYGAGCMRVEIGADHAAEKVYENKVVKNKHGGVILVDGHVYGHSDGVGWVCQNFETGEQVWREREALEAGSIAYADGMFYCLGEDTGTVVLIEASTEGWKEHGRFTLDPQTDQRKERGKIWVHPVIDNGRLYLRDQNIVYCYDVRDAAAAQASVD